MCSSGKPFPSPGLHHTWRSVWGWAATHLGLPHAAFRTPPRTTAATTTPPLLLVTTTTTMTGWSTANARKGTRTRRADRRTPRFVPLPGWLLLAVLKFGVLSVCWKWMQMGIVSFPFLIFSLYPAHTESQLQPGNEI